MFTLISVNNHDESTLLSEFCEQIRVTFTFTLKQTAITLSTTSCYEKWMHEKTCPLFKNKYINNNNYLYLHRTL